VTASPEPIQQLDKQTAAGVLKFHSLWAEFDAEMFSPTPDEQKMLALIVEINTLRNRLAAHGVEVRP
jgi:hypothetical protein